MDKYSYNELADAINQISATKFIDNAKSNLDIKIIQNKTVHIRQTLAKPEYNVESIDSNSYNDILLKTLLLPYLRANLVLLQPKDDPYFLGAARVAVQTIPDIKTVIYFPFVNSKKKSLPFYQYACLLYTNNYSHGIVHLPNDFPQCAHVRIIDKKCYIDYYECILDALLTIQQEKVVQPLSYLNIPSLPFKLKRDAILGKGGQGNVYDIDDKRVVKIFQVGLPVVLHRTDPFVEEHDATKEALILFFLQLKKFPYAPEPFSFGYFNGVFFYIEMSKIKGVKPENKTDMLACREALDELHKLGIIHSDIYPNNLLIREKKTGCLLIDYGLARLASEFDKSEASMRFEDDYDMLKE